MNEDQKNLLSIIGIGSVGYFVFNSIKNTLVNNVIIQLGNPELDKQFFSDGFFKLDVPIYITNNNIFDISFAYFTGYVTYGNIKLANVSIPYNFSIPNGTTRQFNLNTDIPITSVMADLSNAIQYVLQGGSIFDLLINRIELTGTIVLNSGRISVPIPLDRIPIPIV